MSSNHLAPWTTEMSINSLDSAASFDHGTPTQLELGLSQRLSRQLPLRFIHDIVVCECIGTPNRFIIRSASHHIVQGRQPDLTTHRQPFLRFQVRSASTKALPTASNKASPSHGAIN